MYIFALSRGVMSRLQQVTFQQEHNSRVIPRSDTNTQQWREKRDVPFLAGNTVIILSSSQLKMRILRFVVNSVLATKYYQASNEF